MMLQLDFFQDDDTLALTAQVKTLKESNEKVRKSLFAKNGMLVKEVEGLKERLAILEKYICNTW